MSIVGPIVQSSGGGGGTSFTDVNTSIDYTVTGTTSERIYVDTTSTAVTITIPAGASNQIIEVIDAGENAGTNIITIVGTIDGVSNSTIEADSGSRTIAYSGTAWETSGGFQNYFKRNAATGAISTQAPDTLLANAVTSGNAGALSNQSVADTDFTNIGANVDVSVAGEFSNDTGETTLNTFDTRLATSSSGAFSAGTFKAYDNVAALITGTGKVNVAYAVDNGDFIQETLKAPPTLPTSTNTGTANTHCTPLSNLGLSGTKTITEIAIECSTGIESIEYFYFVPNGSNWDRFSIGSETSVSFTTGTPHIFVLPSQVSLDCDTALVGYSLQGSNVDNRYNLTASTTYYHTGSLTGDALNVTYQNGLYDQDTFKALGDIAYTTQFDLRLQLVGTQRFSKATLASPNTVLDLTSDGQAQVMDGGVKVSSFGKKGVASVSLTTTERDALTGMDDGAIIFNETTSKLNFYTGSAWEAITSA
jgi:hypothetical protein